MKLDAGPDKALIEEGEDGVVGGEDFAELPIGSRAGENKFLYLNGKDFSKYGFTPRFRGCLDIVSGKQRSLGGLAPHTKACRCRMEARIQEKEPARWAQCLRRREEKAGRCDRK